MNTNKNSKTDLIAITHPLVLLSILVLLINDHVLKIYFPSALTGKISDFTGLFFFSILLSAILHFVLKSFQIQSRNIALASFGFTTIFFSLIKTVPFFNNFIENLFSIQIIFDSSDLMALIMLPLAWKLREKVVNESKTRISRLSYAVLGIASLAVIATSPPLPSGVFRLIVHEDKVYAGNSYRHDEMYSSGDGGKTWTRLEPDTPSTIFDELQTQAELPVTLCLPEDPDICYQTAEGIILESDDGGTTWVTSWDFPLGRKEFFYRASQWVYLGPYDLAYLELSEKQIVIAAIGNGGVLVKVENEDWENYSVGNIGPLALKANSLSNAISTTKSEIMILSIIGVLLLFFTIITNIKDRKTRIYRLLKTVSVISMVSFLISVLLLPYSYGAGGKIFIITGLVFLLSTTLGILILIQQIMVNTNKEGLMGAMVLLFNWFTSCSVFIAWSYGIIPVYETSLTVVIILNLITIVFIFYKQIKIHQK